ncbi:MAG: MoxR family ATPase [Planctomycetes bacterium]|nr:MoxR family ATPase [Planctomycetota bacterium]
MSENIDSPSNSPEDLNNQSEGQINNEFSEAGLLIYAWKNELAKVIIGQEDVINQIICTVIAGGHILLEGVPGLGKTLIVKALAQTCSIDFGRIQFTPDLMPADITGHALFLMHKQEFTIRKGPIFTNCLLADEINRAPAKTQAALLEAMQELQVTIEGESHQLHEPFIVFATQNPIEQEGTYPLPEAQVDRFLMKVHVPYPSESEEIEMVREVCKKSSTKMLEVSSLDKIIDTHAIKKFQELAMKVDIDEEVLKYAILISRNTRNSHAISLGAGPRGSIALVRAARAKALMEGRNFVIPTDIKNIALPVLRHRISISADMEIEGRSHDEILNTMIAEIPAPRK